MADWLSLALILIASYLLGAVPFGYLVARARGVDIMRQGSGNIGATNVGRVLGRPYGILVFVLDFAKGALPVLAARAWRPAGLEGPPDLAPVAAGVASFLGHLYPVFLGFRGGKGVATAAGVVAVLLPGPTLAAFVTWVAVLAVFRYVSLASLTAAALLCVVRFLGTDRPWAHDHIVTTLFCLLACVLVFVRHRANLQRLAHGTENRLKETPSMLLLSKTLHVLALGLWFGAGVFFTFVVGLSLFHSFEEAAQKPGDERPLWFPLAKVYAGEPPSKRFPEPLRKEQGTRAAGFAVGPMFGWYFGIQAACGLLGTATALGWRKSAPRTRVHPIRAWVLVAALLGVACGWWLERVVDDLNHTRVRATDEVLLEGSPTPDRIAAAEEARRTFGQWHGYSLLVNLTTLGLVTVAMALAAQLPAGIAAEEREGKVGSLKPQEHHALTS